MKGIYLFGMFASSSLLGLYYGYMLKEREEVLKELNSFFKYLIIKISNKSGNMLHCIDAYRESRHIEEFLSKLSELLESGCNRPFEVAAGCLYPLNNEDLEYIKLVNSEGLDYQGQIKALETAVCYWENEIKKARATEKKRQIVSYSGVLAGLALVTIFF